MFELKFRDFRRSHDLSYSDIVILNWMITAAFSICLKGLVYNFIRLQTLNKIHFYTLFICLILYFSSYLFSTLRLFLSQSTVGSKLPEIDHNFYYLPLEQFSTSTAVYILL